MGEDRQFGARFWRSCWPDTGRCRPQLPPPAIGAPSAPAQWRARLRLGRDWQFAPMAQGRRGILRNPKCRKRVRRQGLDIPASRRACERPHEVAMNGSGRAGEAGLRDMRFVPVFQFAGQDCGGFGMRGIACSGRFWPVRGRRELLGTGTFGVGGNLFHDSSTLRGPRSPAPAADCSPKYLIATAYRFFTPEG